jgi:hypothetical protein
MSLVGGISQVGNKPRIWRVDLLSWERATSSYRYSSGMISAALIGRATVMTNTDTNFTYRIDRWDTHGRNIIQHIANVDDLVLAMAAYEAARKHWPGELITLREGARVVKDTRVALLDSRK